MKVRITYAILVVLAFGLIEVGFRFYDSQTGFHQSLLWRLGKVPNDEFYLTAVPKIEGLPEHQLPIRIPDSDDKVGYFRSSGHFEWQSNHPRAAQQLIAPSNPRYQNGHFIIGESAAFGFPLDYEKTFGQLVQHEKVINVAQPGINSIFELALAERILTSYQPKTLIYFLGNNLWIEWMPPYVSTKVLGLKILRQLATSRTVAWIEARFLDLIEMQMDSSGPKAVLEYGLAHPLRLSHLDWEKTRRLRLDVLKKRLEAQVERAKKQKVRVVLMTLPFNYRLIPSWRFTQPFTQNGDHSKQIQKDLQNVYALIKQNEIHQALKAVEAIIEREPQTPFPYYLKGLALEKSGQWKEAEKAYTLSRDNTIGDLGGIPTINKIIKDVAQTHSVEFIDIKDIFDQDAHQRGIYFNQDLISDDCHPTERGHQLIANALKSYLD